MKPLLLSAFTFSFVAGCACGGGSGAAPAVVTAPAPVAPPTPTPTPAPDPDPDKDGLVGDADKCPAQAEDMDSFEDDDGCPDLDNDQDTIADAADQCPDDPECWNGTDDEDGCPERKILLDLREVRILDKIYFEANKSDLKPMNQPILDAIAAVVKGEEGIRKLLIEGHAAPGEKKADKLAEARAAAVRDALLARGVEAERLEVVAHGASKPEQAENKEQTAIRSRRVSFEVVEQPPQPPVKVIGPCGPPPKR